MFIALLHVDRARVTNQRAGVVEERTRVPASYSIFIAWCTSPEPPSRSVAVIAAGVVDELVVLRGSTQ